MANNLLTISMITNDALPVLENKLGMAKYVKREYDDKFAQAGAKIGQTLSVRLPSQFSGRRGAALSVEDDTEISVPVTLTTQYGVDVSFTSLEMTLSMDQFRERVLMPQMAKIANDIDSDGCLLYQDVPNVVGSPGSAPSALSSILAVGQRLNEEAAPDDGNRFLMLDPRSNAALVSGLSTLFNKQSSLSEQYGSGNLADVGGFAVDMDQNIYTHTVGALGGSPTVNGAGQGLASGYADTSSIVTQAWTAAAAKRLNKGDVITFQNVYAVNPQSKRSTNVLRQFVVTQDASSDGSGNMTVVVAPALIYSGPYQNVNSSPASGATITPVGSASTGYPQSLGFHKDAFTFVTADLVMPGGVDMAARKSYKGISMRLVRAYDINTDRFPSRFDVLGGWKTLRRNQAVRLTG